MSPSFGELFGYIKGILPSSTEWDAVIEVQPKDTGVIMRSISLFAVFPASVISERPHVFAESLEEALEMWFIERAMRWQVLVVVSECNETVVGVELRLVDHTDCPLS